MQLTKQAFRFSSRLCRPRRFTHIRAASSAAQKEEGTIADAFASLSGQAFAALDNRFAAVKTQLIRGNEAAVKASWERLLVELQKETKVVRQLGSAVVPHIDYEDIDQPSEHFRAEYLKRGVAIIKGAIAPNEALQIKDELNSYIRANPLTKAFPADNPQVYELYWSPSQTRARAHPNLLKVQSFLLSFWHSKDPDALISSQPISYADRLRMRQPGDAKFALGPHIDGGSCERWEETGYGKGHVYDDIWQGNWEKYDPWESSCRLPVESDLYQGQGACSAFRMCQGWLSLSQTSAFEGTLLVNPLLQLATAYFLLRPFFSSIIVAPSVSSNTGEVPSVHTEEFLSPTNWKLDYPQTSWLQGANPGRGQELNFLLHPHLNLSETMVHVPTVQPGDYVVWHCDTIHAVDKVHAGKSDSSVLYIPACPLTTQNATYLARQRECFLQGIPSPDFPGGVGESKHVGRTLASDVAAVSGTPGMRAMGLEQWSEEEGQTAGEKEVFRQANQTLGFA